MRNCSSSAPLSWLSDLAFAEAEGGGGVAAGTTLNGMYELGTRIAMGDDGLGANLTDTGKSRQLVPGGLVGIEDFIHAWTRIDRHRRRNRNRCGNATE